MKDKEVMKCCACGKDVDTGTREVPPKWFGSYCGCEMKKVICAECIKKPENKEWWKD